MRTKLATVSDLDEIVEIHYSRFSSFFLTTLGKKFLKNFYKAFLKKPGLLLVLEENNKIVGFAAGSFSNQKFFTKLLFNNLMGFCLIGLSLFFTNFSALKRLAFNTTKSEKNNLVFAELLSIATLENNKGYGKYLLESFENQILKVNPVISISLTTDFENNDKAIKFYENAGYKILQVFESYANRKMIRFIKKNN